MSEYLVIATIAVCLVVIISAVCVIRAITALQTQIDSQRATLLAGLVDMSDRMEALEQGINVHGSDIEAIRAEFAAYITWGDYADADYELAIKAASMGQAAGSISQTYGLRDTEAQLLVAVYGGKSAK